MEHTWQINDLIRQLSDGFVFEVNYSCITSYDGMGAVQSGKLTLTGSSTSSGFIPYESLTSGTVTAWVTSSIDYESIQSKNSSSIAENIIIKNLVGEGIPWDEN